MTFENLYVKMFANLFRVVRGIVPDDHTATYTLQGATAFNGSVQGANGQNDGRYKFDF